MKKNNRVVIDGVVCEFAGMTPSFFVEIPTYKQVNGNRYFFLDTDGKYYEYDSYEAWKEDIEGEYLID